MKCVLVTGSNGFIGRHCLPSLLGLGYDVHGVVPQDGMQLDLPGVHWHVLNLLEDRAVEHLLGALRPTHLLHLAWYTEPGQYWHSAENVRWLTASLELLRVFQGMGGQRVVMAGTCAEYDWRYGYCSESLTPLAPASLYGICKASLFQTLTAFAATQGLGAAWGRVFFLYGPHEHPSRLVPDVINALLARRPAHFNGGSQIRDYLHVRDVASAFVALLDSAVTGAVNIASGDPVELRSLVTLIASKIHGLDLLRLDTSPQGATQAPFVVADTRRLRQEVHWKPEYSLDTGLEDTIAWWRAQRSST